MKWRLVVRRNRVRPALAAGIAAHQLQVIHNQQVQAMLGVEAAGLGAQLQDRDGGSVIDKDG